MTSCEQNDHNLLFSTFPAGFFFFYFNSTQLQWPCRLANRAILQLEGWDLEPLHKSHTVGSSVWILRSWNDATTVSRIVGFPACSVQSGCGTLCQQTFASCLLTVSRSISTVSVSFEHRTTSCFYRLHCTVFIRTYRSLFAAQLSRHICLFTRGAILLGIESASVLYRKMNKFAPGDHAHYR